MAIDTKTAKQAVHDKIQAQILMAQSRLEALKVKAEAAKAVAEVKAVVDLIAKKKAIEQKLSALKESSSVDRWEQAKADIDSRVADLEDSVKVIEARLKGAA